MELHQLRYFCAVVREGNFTRAALAERVAQPSLSQQVLKLEAELGARLFDRLPRAAKLTEFGRAFLPKAEAILRQVGEARTEIQEMAGAPRGQVSIGVIPTVAPYFLSPRLAGFARANPRISVSIIEEITPVLLEHVHAGSIDLAVLSLPVGGNELAAEELVREPLFAVLPARHRLASLDSLELRQLREEPFLLLKEGHCLRETTIAACQSARLQPNVVFESGQFASILAMVAAGLGVSVVPQMAVERRKGCRYVRITDKKAFRQLGIVRLKRRFLTLAQRALIDHLVSGAS